MQVFFKGRRELQPTIWEYSFKSQKPVDFVPGQYVSLQLPGVTGDPRGRSRTFTITSQPGDPLITFVLKHFDPQSPYKTYLQSLDAKQPADAAITNAMGDVVLPKLASLPLVFVAGGIGIASFISILNSLAKSGEKRSISLLYGMRSPDQLIYRERLESFPFSARRTFISPGRITAKDILELTRPDSLIYLSGSEEFVENLRENLYFHGISRERVVFDFFDGYRDNQV
jgi:ferredoxin-NADP reductase